MWMGLFLRELKTKESIIFLMRDVQNYHIRFQILALLFCFCIDMHTTLFNEIQVNFANLACLMSFC